VSPVQLVGVLDTNVLMRARLMHFLVSATDTDACVIRWSPEIRAELETTAGRERRSVLPTLLELAAAVDDAVLPVASADRAASTGHCDAKDEHVLAAALCAARLRSHRDYPWDNESEIVLVTENLRDFDAGYALTQGVRVIGVDQFGLLLLEVAPHAVLSVIDREPQERYAGYLRQMRDDGLPKTADRIDELFGQL